MTVSEFSNEFDVLYNNVTSNLAPGLDEYEKSVFLTKAQKIIVRRQFDPASDQLREGFDGSQQRQYDFSTLIVTEDLKNITSDIDNDEKIDRRSSVFVWPSSCFLGVNEIIVDNANNQYSVSPISYDEYHRLMTKPYQYPPKKIAWRMMTNNKKRGFVGGNFANTRYTLPLSEKLLSYVNDSLETSTINKCYLYIYWVEGSANTIVINGGPEQIDTRTAAMQLTITATSDSNLYTYSLESILKLLAEVEAPSLYLNWLPGSNTFALLAIEGTDEHYQVSYVVCNGLWKAFLDVVSSIEFPITLEDIANYGTYVETPSTSVLGLFSIGERTTETLVEIIGRFQGTDGKLSTANINKYKLRYVKTLSPIILVDLGGEGLTVEGETEVKECQLPVECHQEILELAVSLAKVAMAGSTGTLAAAAQDNNK